MFLVLMYVCYGLGEGVETDWVKFAKLSWAVKLAVWESQAINSVTVSVSFKRKYSVLKSPSIVEGH